MNVMKIAYF